MKKILKSTFLLVIVAMLITSASATEYSSSTWNNVVSDYAPDSGIFSVAYEATYACTSLSVRYGADDIPVLNFYAGVAEQYPSLDIKNVPSASDGIDMMDAYSIVTSLPNPKTDIENDDFFIDNRNEEAEVVALGTIEANRSYLTSVYWHDYRSGNSTDCGKWSVNAELADQFVPGGDYNTVSWTPLTQLAYGCNRGKK